MVDFNYLPRFASQLLRKALGASPVVVLMGARQTGKSTLVQYEPFLSKRLYLTLDDPETLGAARYAPEDLVHSAPRLTLDEVQREPSLLLHVKRAVDEDRQRANGRFDFPLQIGFSERFLSACFPKENNSRNSVL